MSTLRDLRLRNKESKQQVADLLGISRATYTNIENEKKLIDSETLLVLARHYGVTTDYILGYDFDEEVPMEEHFAKILKILRLESRMSQPLLSTLTGLPQEDIAEWECGRKMPDEQTVRMLAGFFNVSIDLLIGQNEERNIYTVTEQEFEIVRLFRLLDIHGKKILLTILQEEYDHNRESLF